MKQVTILQSFPVPRPTTNPYLVMLAEALRADPELEVLNFSWRTALLSKYDVFHVHWPEIMVTGGAWHKRTVRQVLFLCLLARLRLGKRVIVRTKHNLELPEGLSPVQTQLLRLFDKNTDALIRLSDETPVDRPSSTIPHGHYKDWYGIQQQVPKVPGRIGYVGLIRRYKGVEALVEAFSALPQNELSLSLGGKPSSASLTDTLTAGARADTRIHLQLGFLSDSDFVEHITASQLMVFPYRFMHNSGGVLAALSLARPVLVPDNPVNRALSAEVGKGWIHFFTAPLDATHIQAALEASVAVEGTAVPNLDNRGWTEAAQAHKAAYQEALARRRNEVAVLS